jgi:hypothetical protein
MTASGWLQVPKGRNFHNRRQAAAQPADGLKPNFLIIQRIVFKNISANLRFFNKYPLQTPILCSNFVAGKSRTSAT